MNNSFITIVGLVSSNSDLLKKYIVNVYKTLNDNFTDFEIILVNNKSKIDIKKISQELKQEVRKEVFVLNLAKAVDPNNAIVAGLDRANGDFTIVFDIEFFDKSKLIVDLYNKAKDNFDIVFLKYKHRDLPRFTRILYKFVYFLINRYSNIRMDMNIHTNSIISRRALNSIIKVREKLRNMKVIYSSVGYNTSSIEVDIDKPLSNNSLSDQFKSAILILTTFTNLIHIILIRIFIISILFCIGVSIDALMTKYFGIGIFGTPSQYIPGWTFLVVMASVMFSFLTLILYIFSFYLANINNEIKERPLYFIESIQRL
ncbi:MAG: hypothetical protein CMG69_03855 [Candidatus Marinimicrobia bacterium]|nr:hypothetical protein [Candidatus Neomarinimicrobiota bacterium]|tara:strand:- start:630 stop:1574 length:945 start_codon:yes stop_codon:yes gene_type:complete